MTEQCPFCRMIRRENEPRATANDGGSTICSNCGILYHQCSMAESGYRTGSPGPALCECGESLRARFYNEVISRRNPNNRSYI